MRTRWPTRILCKYSTGRDKSLNIFLIWRLRPSFRIIFSLVVFGVETVIVMRQGRVFLSDLLVLLTLSRKSSGRNTPLSSFALSCGVSRPSTSTKYSFSFSYRGWVNLLMSSRSFVRMTRPSVSLSRRPIGLRPLSFRLAGMNLAMVGRLNSSFRVVMWPFGLLRAR